MCHTPYPELHREFLEWKKNNWLNAENITKDLHITNVYKGPECKHSTQEIFQEITIQSTQIISHL